MNFIHGLFIGVALFFGSLWSGTFGFLHLSAPVATSTPSVMVQTTSQTSTTSAITIIYNPDGTPTGLGKDTDYIYVGWEGWVPIVGKLEPSNYSERYPDSHFTVDANIDPSTFVALGGNYFKDKNQVYYSETDITLIKDADFTTFTVLKVSLTWDAQDKNHKYLRGQIVQDTSATPVSSKEFLAEYGNHSLYFNYTQNSTTGYFSVVDKKNNQEVQIGGIVRSFYGLPIIFTDDGNGKYVALSEGTSVLRGVEIYSLENGKQVAQFCALHTALFWKDVAIYEDCDHSGNFDWEAGLPSIGAVNLKTGQVKILVASSTQSLFGDIIISNDSLLYSSTPLLKDSRGRYSIGTSSTQQSLNLQTALAGW